MTNEPFYVTTPIYYVNDEPHLGHAYTTVLADVLARYARLWGRETFFLTGTDEHGWKVERAAQSHNVSTQAQADAMVVRFQEAWQRLYIEPDDFIRTTEPRHRRVVQAVLQQLWEQGDIYQDDYTGWYCVPDERFWTEKDVVDGNCPDCGRPVEQLAERNYFFRMSRYQSWLIATIEENPNFIRPATRRNEVLGFLQKPLGDLCISRPVARLNWGIPLPFDPNYVTYVWFDALLNYVTAPGYLQDEERFARLWPQVLHLIGKDILITHSVYWPTMLHAAGLPLPRQIFAHGWWIMGEEKMSKSLGNVVKPLDLADKYGVDAFRYFLLREMTLGRDTNFSESGLAQRYHGNLANNLGNLLHRLTHMIARYCDGQLPAPGTPSPLDTALRRRAEELIPAVRVLVEALALNQALADVVEFAGEINRYLEQTAPWELAKAGDRERLATVLYTAAEALRIAAVLLAPVLPERMALLWQRLGWQAPMQLADGLGWGELQPGAVVGRGAPLFPRLDEVTEPA
ncbi:MAG: methionine--tRNA ligase [Anaerolineae bacterium]|nr:methionine--tRNA ligase [Anaerolineae bacterium]